jgi:PPOX class probable F420-dependent enzyme
MDHEPATGVALPEEADAVLVGKPVAFMTTMRPDGHMSTNPVAVVYDGTHIRVSTVTSRRKYRNLQHDDRVTLCIVDPDNLNRYVEIRGRAVIEADADRSFINGIAKRYMGVDSYPFDRPGDDRVTITVIAEQVSCPRVPLSDAPPYRER